MKAFNRIIVVGATSAIVQATLRLFAQKGVSFVLLGRDAEKLQAVASDLQARGSAASFELFNSAANAALGAQLESAATALGGMDLLLLGHGDLPDQAACETSIEALVNTFQVNCLSHLAFLSAGALIVEKQGYGTLADITSVAGDRGRAPNYVYGSAKAAVSTFLSGLRARLYNKGIVLDIRPGFVDTPMTAGMKKGLLFASPETVAADIHKAILNGSDVLYTPWFWRYIMLIIRVIPTMLFKKLRF